MHKIKSGHPPAVQPEDAPIYRTDTYRLIKNQYKIPTALAHDVSK